MTLLLSLFACSQSDADTSDTGDEADVGCDVIAYTDADGDGWGDLDTATVVCELGADQVALGGDCDDANPAATPDTQWFVDADGDGHGDPTQQIASCDPQDGLVSNQGDCDDLDASSHPQGVEVCDGADNDCDGTADDGASDASTWYADADQDGFGDPDTPLVACEQPEGSTTDTSDCDDSDPWISPDAEEICDGLDNDCDGHVDFDGWIPSDYATLADALDAESDGAHLCLDEGTHAAGDLTYVGALTLEGQGSSLTVLDAEDQGFLQIEGDFELRGATLSGIVAQSDSYSPGIHQEQGDVTLDDVVIQDVLVDTEVEYTGYAVALYCWGPGDLTLLNVVIQDVEWDLNSDQYEAAGGMIECWGGALDVQGLTVSDVRATGTRQDPVLSYWAVGDAVVSDVEISDMTHTLTAPSWAYVYGPLTLDGLYQVLIEDVDVHDLETTVAVDDGSVRLYGSWLGQFGSDRQDATLRRIRVEDNSIEADAATVYAYGLLARSYYEGTAFENLVMARNTASGATVRYGTLFSGDSVSVTNADVVDNALGAADSDYGLIYAYGSHGTELVNVNLVGNTASADSTPYGSLVSLLSDDATLTWDGNNVYDNTLPGDIAVARSDGTEVTGTTSLAVDPQYTDQSGGDYTLSASSPVIDAGSADLLDADGSLSDIGAHGGTGAW